MREILFRAKDKYNEWVYGDVIFKDAPLIVQHNKNSSEVHTIFEDTLGQYSGVLDSNGEKIFEGDILKMTYAGKYLGGVNGIAEVVFQDGKFGVIWGWHKELVALDGFANTKIEVIGNVFDNSELLEAG